MWRCSFTTFITKERNAPDQCGFRRRSLTQKTNTRRAHRSSTHKVDVTGACSLVVLGAVHTAHGSPCNNSPQQTPPPNTSPNLFWQMPQKCVPQAQDPPPRRTFWPLEISPPPHPPGVRSQQRPRLHVSLPSLVFEPHAIFSAFCPLNFPRFKALSPPPRGSCYLSNSVPGSPTPTPVAFQCTILVRHKLVVSSAEQSFSVAFLHVNQGNTCPWPIFHTPGLLHRMNPADHFKLSC